MYNEKNKLSDTPLEGTQQTIEHSFIMCMSAITIIVPFIKH